MVETKKERYLPPRVSPEIFTGPEEKLTKS
jgi:hypothetical protein